MGISILELGDHQSTVQCLFHIAAQLFSPAPASVDEELLRKLVKYVPLIQKGEGAETGIALEVWKSPLC